MPSIPVPTPIPAPSAHRLRTAARRVTALVGVAALAAGAVLIAATPAVAATVTPENCRSLPVDADAELRSDLARAEFDVDGTGVKVGIISNTYSSAGQSAIDADVAAGLLPGAANPCGWLTPVTELFPSPAGGDDEGRAMAQLVHGIAPGAELYFAPATANGTAPALQYDMIDAVNALVGAGVDVIVDDISVPDEPFFQESALSGRIGQLEAEGIVYLSAAGNETVVASAPLDGQRATPVNGWSTTAFRPTACETYVATAVTADPRYTDAVFDCMDFDTTGTPDSTALYGVLPDKVDHDDTVYLTAALMQWGETFGTTPQGTFEMVISAITTTGTGSAGEACTELAPCTASGLVPDVEPTSPLRYASEFELPNLAATTDIEVSLVRVTHTTPTSPVVELAPAIGFLFPNNGSQWIAYAEHSESNGDDLVGRTVLGHNGAPGAITIAATGYQAAGDAIEKYSSLGPVRYTLSPQTSSPQITLPEVQTRHLPELVSVDGVRQTVLLDYPVPGEPGVGYFYGTSAATPNAGAVVALARQLDPTLTTTRARAYLAETATRLDSPYAGVSVEDSVGAGLVNAQAFLQRVAADLPAPTPGEPVITVLPATGATDTGGTLALGAALTAVGLALVALRRRTARR